VVMTHARVGGGRVRDNACHGPLTCVVKPALIGIRSGESQIHDATHDEQQ
jgi:hypothetical protein